MVALLRKYGKADTDTEVRKKEGGIIQATAARARASASGYAGARLMCGDVLLFYWWDYWWDDWWKLE